MRPQFRLLTSPRLKSASTKALVISPRAPVNPGGPPRRRREFAAKARAAYGDDSRTINIETLPLRSTHTRIIANPKTPCFLYPFFGVIDSNARTARNLAARDRNALFNPNSIAK